jgi:peptidoglycan/LPS O-acetylase OafA/YrhL
MRSTTPSTPLQTDIAGLRAISVVMVVLYHFNLSVLGAGFVGVDIFFVISGYLMTRIIVDDLAAGTFNYFSFLLKRALRIFPALFVLVAVLLAAGALLLPPSDLENLARQCLSAVFFNSNNYYAGQQGYFAQGIDDRWLLHTWSLSVEWQFYMLYPAIVWAGLQVGRLGGAERQYRLLGVFLLAVALASLALCVVSKNQDAFFSVLTRSWQMIAGGLVYMARDSSVLRRVQGAVLSYAGLLLIGASVWVVQAMGLKTAWPSYHALLPVAGACLLLAAGYEGNRLLNNALMQKLGAWSYSIYLWHWPIVIAFTITGVTADAPKLAKLVGIPLSLALGCLSFRYIEPARRLRAAGALSGTVKLASAAAMLCLVALGYQATGGLALRADNPALFHDVRSATQAKTYRPECENPGPVNDRFCRLNTGAAGEKVLVLGDSHAGHLYAWFARHSQRDTTFYVKSGCPLIPGFESVGQNRGCRAFTDKAYALAGSGRYATVVVSMNWSGFSESSRGICSYEDGACVIPPKSRDPQLPLTLVRASLQSLLDRNVKVVVVDATPAFRFNVPNRVARHAFWYGEADERAQAQDLLVNNAGYDRLFASLDAQPGFALVSPRRRLCKVEQCMIYDRQLGLPLYTDNDHFNPAWLTLQDASFLAPHAEPAAVANPDTRADASAAEKISKR